MNGTLVGQYIDQNGQEILVLEFRSPFPNVITRFQDQWEQQPDGTVRAWYTRPQWDECIGLANALAEEYV